MTPADTCPMTGEAHLWGDWERVIDVDERHLHGDRTRPATIETGDRARECRVCGRWDIEWVKS